LVRTDHIVPGFDLDPARLERVVRAVDLEALTHELVHCVHRVSATTLARRDNPSVDRPIDASAYGSLVLHPVVVEEHLPVIRDVLEGEQYRRLLDIGVVPGSPFDAG